jgi:hypothetical protein
MVETGSKAISHIHIAFPTHIHITVAHITVTHGRMHRVVHFEYLYINKQRTVRDSGSQNEMTIYS